MNCEIKIKHGVNGFLSLLKDCKIAKWYTIKYYSFKGHRAEAVIVMYVYSARAYLMWAYEYKPQLWAHEQNKIRQFYPRRLKQIPFF